MTTGATFLSVSDVGGDLQYLAHVLELAERGDVAAQAVFITGNLPGQLLTPEERVEYDGARVVLQKELESRREFYLTQGITDIGMLGHYMSLNGAEYRRQAESTALRSLRVLVGLKDGTGRVVEPGRASMRARRFYTDAEKLFRRCTIPIYVMGDTVLAEDAIHPGRWLHFAWFSFAGYSMRGLPSLDGDASGVPELAIGLRRGGEPISLDEYSLASGDIIFAKSLNPVLHETLNTVPGKLVIVGGEGHIELDYPNTIVASQRPRTACFYSSAGVRFMRRTYLYDNGRWAEPTLDDIAAARKARGDEPTKRRRELQDHARLASFGTELVSLVDLVRAENPSLASEIEKSRSRVEAILTYVRDLEAQRTRLLDTISTQRAGIERLVRALEPVLGESRAQQASQALNLPPVSLTDVGALDAANLEVVRLLEEALGSGPKAAAAEQELPGAPDEGKAVVDESV